MIGTYVIFLNDINFNGNTYGVDDYPQTKLCLDIRSPSNMFTEERPKIKNKVITMSNPVS